MKFQAWLKLQNSASHFTTDLLQMHHDSCSWVHWTQQKFEEDQSFTCMVFREGLSMHSHCQGQGAMWNSQQELGPSHQPGKGADRLGGSQSTPSPTARCVCGDTPGLGHSWKVCKSGSGNSQAEMGQGWGQGHLPLVWGQSRRLSWNGVHFNAFHSALSSS